MKTISGETSPANAPREPKRRHSHDENLDEPAKLIESEPVDAETETPEEENVPVESVENSDQSGPPVFEDDETANG